MLVWPGPTGVAQKQQKKKIATRTEENNTAYLYTAQ